GGDQTGTGTGTTSADTSAADDPFPAFGAGKDKSLAVPQNVLDWIQAAADEFDTPPVVLAAVLHQRINTRWTSLSPQIVSQVALALADRFDARVSSMDVEITTSDKKLFNEQ